MGKLSAAPPVIVQKSGRAIPGAWTAKAFISLTIVCWLMAGMIAYLVISAYDAFAKSDYQIGSWIDSLGLNDGFLLNVALVWHWTGGPIGTFVFATVATIWLLVIRRWGWALYVVACGVGGLVIAEVIKRTVNRARPNWPDTPVTESGGSFPSGHSMAGIYVWAVVGVVLIYLLRRPLGTVLGWCLVVFGVLMAPSRLVIGVHWPSDVIAGWLLALGWVLLVTAVAVVIVARRSLKAESSPPPPPESEPVSST